MILWINCFSLYYYSIIIILGYQTCKVNILTEKCTPINTICTQNTASEDFGSCKCIDKYQFNEHYTSDKDYCSLIETSTIAEVDITSNDISIEKTQTSGYSRDILVAVLTVIILICLTLPAAFIIYKYGIYDWICRKVNGNRMLPRYEDVMIGQEDTDDDPLP